ncbi:hypothetical protein EYF80_033029 [Liparis tanakae]|uniref:Uncharacterized protein n=1 Tax=Liparis tanakae TaxID=230148 RepID=A0A4Z2GTV7_9TELE|nr:hypothetical protein EYF80_033029 [Liparis tanakae]
MPNASAATPTTIGPKLLLQQLRYYPQGVGGMEMDGKQMVQASPVRRTPRRGRNVKLALTSLALRSICSVAPPPVAKRRLCTPGRQLATASSRSSSQSAAEAVDI